MTANLRTAIRDAERRELLRIVAEDMASLEPTEEGIQMRRDLIKEGSMREWYEAEDYLRRQS